MNTLSIIIAVVTLIVGTACLFVAWLQYRRMPKLPEPAYEPSVVAFDIVRMKEPSGLPGHDGERRYVGIRGRANWLRSAIHPSFVGPCFETGVFSDMVSPPI